MPRNSSGIYSPPANTEAVADAIISPTAYNTLQGDQGTELTNSLDRQGRGPMLADLPMGGYRIQNLADPSVPTDGVNKRYADANYLPSSDGSVTNAKLSQAPARTIKGTLNASPSSTATVTITIATPGVVTWAAHGLADNAAVILDSTGNLPTGFTKNVVYYVVAATKTTNTFQLSATPGGAAINTSGAQSGVHTASVYPQSVVRDLPVDYLGQFLTDSIILPSLAVGTVITNNAVTPDTSISVTARAVTISNATGGNVRRQSVSVTINATTVGANGMDAGVLANNTWYYVHLIDNGTTMAGLLSLSATAPTLPSGYKYSLRIGAARTDGTAKLYRFIQTGNQWAYVVLSSGPTTRLPAILSGSAGDIAIPTYVSVGVRANSGAFPAAIAPLTANTISIVAGLLYGAGGGAVIAAPNAFYGSYTSTTNPPPIMNASYSYSSHEMVFESNAIFVASNALTNTILLGKGFTDTAAVI